MGHRVFVISDLHMAAENSGFFSAGEDLASFLHHVKGTPGQVDLVILGDALDYLQIEPYLSFTAAQAEAKTRAIVRDNAAVFSALRAFVGTEGKRLRWAIGNHDLELVFPIAQELLERAVLGEPAGPEHPKLTWHLDGGPIDYCTWNRAVIRLVHGNQGDPWNAIDYQAAASAAHSGEETRRVYPPGSVLVAEVLNPLHAQGFRHVHMLKPETTVALPLSLALWPDEAWRLACTAFPLLARKTRADLTRWLREALGVVSKKTFAPSPPPADGATIEQLFAALLHQTITGADSRSDDVLADDLGSWLTRPDAPKLLDAYLKAPRAEETEKFAPPGWVQNSISALLQGAARSANEAANPWILDQHDDLAEPVQSTFSAGEAAVLIAGHTHLARTVSYLGGYYVNTGTWADLMKIPRTLAHQEFRDYARELRTALRDPESCPFALRPFRRLTYADIHLGDSHSTPSYRVDLCEWPTESPKILHRFP